MISQHPGIVLPKKEINFLSAIFIKDTGGIMNGFAISVVAWEVISPQTT
jgi:hypothetical protein